MLISGVIGADAYGSDPALGVLFGVLTAIAYSAFLLPYDHMFDCGVAPGG